MKDRVSRPQRRASRHHHTPLRLEILEDRTLLAGNPIVTENLLPGNPSSEWNVSGMGDPNLQGFASGLSVDQGQTVDFKIKTTATAYHIDIYRMGYYAGMGARKVATIPGLVGQPQPDAITDPATGLYDCGNWNVSASWAVPATATSGIYFAKLIGDDGVTGSSHVLFIVRDDDGASDLLFQTSDTTWQAYNQYGGTSLYRTTSPTLPARGYKVSYNRPFENRDPVNYYGAENWVFHSEYPMVQWLEANGYNVSYTTGLDTATRGNELLEHRAFLSVGHDEYWSNEMRANVEAARDTGVNLAFFSGNEVFWKVRWEDSIDGTGTPYRTMVCYKETDAAGVDDPDPTVWTGTWRDPTSSPPHDGGRPENSLTGQFFAANGTFDDRIWVPEEEGKLRFWRNTSLATLQPGQQAGLTFGSLGFEWDIDTDNGYRPAGSYRVSSSTYLVPLLIQAYNTTVYAPGMATHNMTIYRAPSGALVFGAGTIQWSWGLHGDHDRYTTTPDVRMQQATVNLFADMLVQPGSLQPGLVPAAASTDVTAPTTVITSVNGGAPVQVGATVLVVGTAADGGGRVAGVEVSTDGGLTWRRANGRANWSYSWTPTAVGTATILARATDDSSNTGPVSPLVPVAALDDAATGPQITGVSPSGLTTSGVTVAWTTDEPSTTRIDYGTSPTSLTQTSSNATLVAAHTLTLTGLTPNTRYYYRVVSTDEFNNTTTTPTSPATLTFTTPAYIDTTFTDFAAGTPGTATYLTGGGEVTLVPTAGTEFSGTALDAGWQSALNEAGGSVTVSGGTAALEGTRVSTTNLYGPGRSMEFVATFNGLVQFGGFIQDAGTIPWAVFITLNDGQLYARTNPNVGAIIETPLPLTYKNAPHRFRIDWNANSIDYWIDGLLVVSHTTTMTGTLRPFAYDQYVDGKAFVVDNIRLSPYTSPGTYTSKVFDAGANVNWTTLAWAADTPAGTGVVMRARAGNTPTPDATWSSFVTVAGSGGSVNRTGRYFQYAADLSTSAAGQTPALKEVAINTGGAVVQVAFATAASSGGEATTAVSLPVTLSAASTQTVTVAYAVTGGTATGGGVDYTLPAGTLTFAPGETSKNVTLAVVNDTIDEPNETLVLTLSVPSNATLGTNTTHTYTITDNDPVPVVAFAAASSSGSEALTPASLVVNLGAVSGKTVTVNYAATGGTATGGGTDYTLAAGALTFLPGETSKTIPIAINNDTTLEANETVVVTLSAPANATLGATTAHTYTILDNDSVPTVGFTAGAASGSESTLAVTLAVTLSAASTQTVTVNYAASGGTATGGGVDYLLPAGTLSFAPGETSKTIPLTVVYDRIDEANETVVVTLTAPTNANLGTASHTYAITDNGLSVATDGVVYFTTTGGGTISGSVGGSVTFTDADLLRLAVQTSGSYSYVMYFDGSDVGLAAASEDIDAMTILADGRILVSTEGAFSVPGSGGTLSGSGEDILQFTPVSLGDATSGTWSMYFDGSDVGLSGTDENIDAIGVLPDGRLVISTTGPVAVPGVSGADEDLLAFTATSLGTATAGTWSMYFDGSDVGLSTSASEDIDGVDVQASGGAIPVLYFSTTGTFAVTGASGDDEDVFQFNPTTVGPATAGTFTSALTVNGSLYGLGAFDIDGFRLTPTGGAVVARLASLPLGSEHTLAAGTSQEVAEAVANDRATLGRRIDAWGSELADEYGNRVAALLVELVWWGLNLWRDASDQDRFDLVQAIRWSRNRIRDTTVTLADAALCGFLLSMDDG